MTLYYLFLNDRYQFLSHKSAADFIFIMLLSLKKIFSDITTIFLITICYIDIIIWQSSELHLVERNSLSLRSKY